MPPELFALALLAALIWGVYHVAASTRERVRRHASRFPRASPTQPRQTPRRAVSRATRLAARNLQLVLLQLRQAPDFRRAANCAAQAREVPLWFRQRQYRRFRPLIVRHLAQLLARNVSLEAVMPALTQLVTGLGMAAFEADYVRIDAQALAQAGRREAPRPDFAQQLRTAQTDHRNRLRTLESVPDLDAETREQLLEQERMQFQERLRTLAGEEHQQHAR
jgi:hypothetical protein